MLNYMVAAGALKAFSFTPQTRKLYRFLGNVLGANRRISIGLPDYYVDRGLELIDIINRHQAVRQGDHILEIGTGWMHWESIFIRLFNEVQATLFDVWDNRQLKPLKSYVAQLDKAIEVKTRLPFEKTIDIHELIKAITSVNSFPELYNLLGFQYVVDPNGTLRSFRDAEFALVYSTDVLEHVEGKTLGIYLNDICRILKPGGYSVHKIDLHDHLAFYDKGASQKTYLKYSDSAWKHYFENKVQYFNRIQRPEWLQLFQSAGLTLVQEESRFIDVRSLKVSPRYRDLTQQDLACSSIRVVHRKPL
jgi:cyclopropane fatty-acyl-phospholipid synthase-like methyltransferase